MSMLNFKYGAYSNLPSKISNGTIYVTTDEKAMYVDLNDNRIRLSQIITLSTHDWKQLPPPYSKEAFYYLTDSNALLKYNGDGTSATGWVQINSTAEIDGILESLGFHGAVADLNNVTDAAHGDIYRVGNQSYVYNANITEGSKWVAIGKIGAEIVDLEAAVAALQTTIAGHGSDISTLKTDVDAAEAAIANLEALAGFKGKVDSLPTSAIVGDIYLVGTTYNVCVKIESGAPKWEPIVNESARIEALRAEIARVEAAAGTAEGVKKIQEELTRVAGLVDDDTTGLEATKEIADNAAKAISQYSTAHANDYNNAKIDELVADAKAAGTGASSALDAYKETNDEAVNELSDEVDTLKNANFVKADGTVEMNGNLDLGTHKIVDLAAPEANGDAANKKYVDDAVKVAKDAADAADTKAGNAATAAANAATRIDTIEQGATLKTFKAIEEALSGKQATIPENTYDAYGSAAAVETKLLGDAEKDSVSSNTIAGAHKAAAAAQSTATDAANAAAAITNGATAKTLKELEEKISGISGNIGDLDKTFAKDEDVENALNELKGSNDDGTVYSGTVKGAYDKANEVDGKLTTESGRIDDILDGGTDYQSFGDVETKLDAIDQTILNLGDIYATDSELNTAKTTILGEYTVGEGKQAYTGSVGAVYDKAATNEANITTLDGKVSELEEKVDRELQAADAMIFKGTVAAESGLPSSGVSVGDTYKAIDEFTMANGTKVFIGDLLIASGDEAEGVITENLVWNHVPSGYVADYNPKMKLVHVAKSNTVDVNLTSAHAESETAGDLGDFQISGAEGSAVTVSVASGNNIAIGMTWGTF